MTLAAYLNHGRWVVDCPACPSAALAGATFACEDCGYGPEAVQMPAEAADVEDAVRPRPLRNRNWRPTETVADLEAENAEHGL
jgi:hypothetical protein